MGIILFGYVRGVEAKPYLTVTCKDIKGPRIDYMPLAKGKTFKKFEQSEDKISGTRIIFILEKKNSKVLINFSEDTHLVPKELRADRPGGGPSRGESSPSR